LFNARQGDPYMSAKFLFPAAAVVAVCFLWGELPTRGQFNSDEDAAVLATLDAEVKRFLDTVAAGDVDAALRELMTDSNLSPDSDDVRALATKAAALETNYGMFRGLEKIDSRRVATDLVVMKYLYKCERFPVVWYFTFYRSAAAGAANGQWAIVTIRFDAELEALAK